jgi:hypothetical protein
MLAEGLLVPARPPFVTYLLLLVQYICTEIEINVNILVWYKKWHKNIKKMLHCIFTLQLANKIRFSINLLKAMTTIWSKSGNQTVINIQVFGVININLMWVTMTSFTSQSSYLTLHKCIHVLWIHKLSLNLTQHKHKMWWNRKCNNLGPTPCPVFHEVGMKKVKEKTQYKCAQTQNTFYKKVSAIHKILSLLIKFN